jgi:hypothetical protein
VRGPSAGMNKTSADYWFEQRSYSTCSSEELRRLTKSQADHAIAPWRISGALAGRAGLNSPRPPVSPRTCWTADRPRARRGHRAQLEGRRVLADRRHRQSRRCCTSRRARVDEARRHCAPDVRLARCRDLRRPALGRRRRAGDDPHADRGARSRRLGLVVLSSARRRAPHCLDRASALALSPSAAPLPPALHTAASYIPRRGDGGHMFAISGRGRVDPPLQQMRFAPQFLPMFVKRWCRPLSNCCRR